MAARIESMTMDNGACGCNQHLSREGGTGNGARVIYSVLSQSTWPVRVNSATNFQRSRNKSAINDVHLGEQWRPTGAQQCGTLWAWHTHAHTAALKEDAQ